MATVKLSKKITERIRELNETGLFGSELRLGGVARQLSTLPLESALEVLEGLEQASEAHADPTTFVVAAVSALQASEAAQEAEAEAEAAPEAEEAAEAEEAEEAAEEAEDDWNGEPEWNQENGETVPELLPSVDQKIRNLNKSGKLCTKIDLSKVGTNMQRLSEPIALQLLKDVEANADMVDKPNHLIADASRKIFESGHGDVGKKVAEQIGILMKRIRWINSNISLAYPLHMGNVLSLLQDMEHKQALQVLKSVVENAEEIKSPQAFIRREKQRLEGHGKGKKGKGKRPVKNGSKKGGGKASTSGWQSTGPAKKRNRQGQWASAKKQKTGQAEEEELDWLQIPAEDGEAEEFNWDEQ